jgi:glycosyltransferase involved in cell wall biosynthesis
LNTPSIAADAPSAENGQCAAEVELTILMPCLNEAETLAACIDNALGFLNKQGISGEVLIADNGSTDGSQELARRQGARVVDVPVRGYGSALYHGTQAARGKYVIMGDSDGSYDLANLMPFVDKLRSGHELVMGNRFQGGIKPGAMPWKNRWIGNPLLSGIGRLFFHCPVGDFHCGLRGYSRQAFEKMDLRTTGMEFASEMVIKATLQKMRLAEVPTTLSPHGRSRPPNLRPWRDGWRHLRFMLLFSPRWLFLYPGFLAMVVGLVVILWLLPGQRSLGRLKLDVHTMLFAAFTVILGFQAVMFAVFGRMLATTNGFLPSNPWTKRLGQATTLEWGLIVGCFLVVLGFAASLAAVVHWERQSFGPLDPLQVMRIIIPAGLAICLGFQTVLASFFLGVLRLGCR